MKKLLRYLAMRQISLLRALLRSRGALRKISASLSIMLILFSLPLSAAVKWSLDVDQGNGRVEFIAIGKPKALKIRGKGEKPKGKITIENGKIVGDLSFDLSSLDTGISLRNRHLKEKYLEIGKFPKAELKLTKIDQIEKILSSEEIDLDSLPFEGILSLHGVKKPVSGKTCVEKKKQTIDLKAAFDIKIKDFDIAVPSYAGITVADNIKIEVDLKAPLFRQGTAEHVIPSPRGEKSVHRKR